MSLTGARIFHINVNCRDLETATAFYVNGVGLQPGTRTTPDAEQPGAAFGLDRARWDAWILVGDHGFAGGAIDLLEWQQPTPSGAPPASLAQPGFARIGVSVPDLATAMSNVESAGGRVWSEIIHHSEGGNDVRLVMTSDPDGTCVELFEGAGPRLMFVGVTCADIEASVAFYQSLGFVELLRVHSDAEDGAHLHLPGPVSMDEVMMAAPGGGEVMLMLASFASHREPPGDRRAANTLGMWRCALLVPDIELATAELRSAGAELISEPVSMAMGPGLPELRFVCGFGPDGEVIELIESPT